MRSIAAVGLLGGLLLRQKARRPDDLTGQVALITGGSRGLGLLLAGKLAQQGCRVAICARDSETLQRAREKLESNTGASILTIPGDVSDPEQMKNVTRETTERLGPIDILINVAGIIQVGPVETMDIRDFREAMDVMYWGVVNTSLAVLPSMIERRRGHIVNITSIGGKISVPHLLPYSSAKFAAVGFTQGLAAEVRQHGVHVTNIAPGLMRTGSHLHAQFKGRQEDELTWFGLGASAPLLAMDADRAAQQVISALERGEPDRVLSLPAVTAATFHGIFPGLTVDLLSLVNRFVLPKSKPGESGLREGGQIARSSTGWYRAVTTLGERAAERLNQRPENQPHHSATSVR